MPRDAPSLISPATFRSRYFLRGEAPTDETVRRWIARRIVPGRVLRRGKQRRYLIDERYLRLPSTGNPSQDEMIALVLAGAWRSARSRRGRLTPQ